MRVSTDRRRQRGVALIMVMITLTVLMAMTVDFMENNELSVRTAVNHRDAIQAEYLARSAVNLSRLLLSAQSLPMMEQVGAFPVWEYADLILDPFSASEGEDMMGDLLGVNMAGADGLGLPAGHEFQVTIVDEDSKININQGSVAQQPEAIQLLYATLMSLVAPEMYDDVFSGSGDRPDVTREQVIREIIDYIDADADEYMAAGGENSYYSALTPSYERKNAPFDSLQELFFVHGVGDDFWSAFVEPDAENPATRVLTIWGTGKINVNTANPQVLLSGLCMLAMDGQGNDPCADMMTLLNLMRTVEAHNILKGLIPVSNVREFVRRIGGADPLMSLIAPDLTPFSVPQARAQQLFSTKSQVFSIYATGQVGNVQKRIHAVVDAEPRMPDMLDPSQSLTAAGGRVLYWRQE